MRTTDSMYLLLASRLMMNARGSGKAARKEMGALISERLRRLIADLGQEVLMMDAPAGDTEQLWLEGTTELSEFLTYVAENTNDDMASMSKSCEVFDRLLVKHVPY